MTDLNYGGITDAFVFVGGGFKLDHLKFEGKGLKVLVCGAV